MFFGVCIVSLFLEGVILANTFCYSDYQVFEIAPSLNIVQLRKADGDTLEFHEVFLKC